MPAMVRRALLGGRGARPLAELGADRDRLAVALERDRHLLARAALAERARGRRPCSPRGGRRCSSARRRRARRRCRRSRRAPRGRRRGCRRAARACRAARPRRARRPCAARPRTPRNGRRTRPAVSSSGSTRLDRRGGDREADPDAARGAVAGGDLRVDADHAAGRVEQRAARVAGVERRVGLDDVLDREAARRRDAPLQRRDDARGQRALEPERVADRDRRVADAHGGGVAELERVQRRRPSGSRPAPRGRCRGPCRSRAPTPCGGRRTTPARRSRRRRRARW